MNQNGPDRFVLCNQKLVFSVVLLIFQDICDIFIYFILYLKHIAYFCTGIFNQLLIKQVIKPQSK